jgi:hypothetical protein
MPNVKLEARATMNGGVVNWKLCHIDPPKPDNCGNAKSPFPDITLGANQGAYIFSYKIVQPTGLGLKFSNEPIWIQQGSQPTGPGVDPQITILPSSTPTELKFRDANDKPNNADPDPVILKYQLNFVDQNNNAVTSIDPDITNGGTNTKSWDFADYLLPAGVSLLAGILLTILFRSLVLRKAW